MAQDYSRFIEKLKFSNLKRDEILAPYTTFGIGGKADLFLEIKQTPELQKAVLLAKEEKIPFLILGGGSNLLISDDGFRGLVIRLLSDEFKVTGNNIDVSAGLPTNQLVKRTAEHLLSGLEFLAGIPGSVGGAIVGNAGAWGKGIGDRITAVEIIDDTNNIIWLKEEDCQFAYRDSLFKRKQWIILRAKLVLEKSTRKIIQKKIDDALEMRRSLPSEPSAGCVFVNPKPLIVGKLVEACELKGKSVGKAQISTQHGNFIVNKGGASARDVVSLINIVKNEVKKKHGIYLQEEIRLIGFQGGK